METIIYLVRHGETEANVTETLQGQSDVPLNGNGLMQARQVGERLRKKHFDVIRSSDLSRARITAEAIAGERQITFDPFLREWDLGEWVGLKWSEISEKYPAEAAAFKKGSMDSPVPGGESRKAFYARAERVLKELIAAFPGKEILCVSHGGMLRAMLNVAAKGTLPISIRTDNTCFCCLKYLHSSESWQMVFWNDTSHLEGQKLSNGW